MELARRRPGGHMSMDRCLHCSRLVDTDYDLDCYVRFVGHKHEVCICEPCRDDIGHDDEEDRP